MNEIPDLKREFTFLKKLDSRVRALMDTDGKKKSGTKERVRTNFLLHPKRISSDSECSTSVETSSPRKFFSATVIKSLSLDEPNNNFKKRASCVMSQTESIYINEDSELRMDISHIESASNKTILKSKQNISAADHSKASTVSTKRPQKVRPNSYIKIENFDKKFSCSIERSLKLLNNIRQIFEKGIGPPDGEEDLARRLKRLQEFSARFSRTYLYPLLRHIDELSTPERLSPTVIKQKMLYTQQIIQNGLQAYYNYLPSSTGKCSSDKLKTLLEQILALCLAYTALRESKTETIEFVNIMRTQTELLIQTVETFDLKVTEKIRKVNEIKSAPEKKKHTQNDKKKSKLSMYAVSASFRKDLEWKKTVEALAKKKYNVKSKYKTACFKHRPPVVIAKEKPHIVHLPSKTKLFPKRSASSLTTTPLKSPIKEDEIKTMVEMEPEIVAPPNSGQLLNHENNAASNEQLVRDSDPPIEVAEDESSLKRALEVLKKFFGESNQDQILEKIAKEVKNQKKKEVEEQPKKKLKEPVVTVSGARNAKLICIRDDNSIVETDDEVKKDKEVMTDVEIKMATSETQTDLLDQSRTKNSKSSIKISRLPKTSRKMLKLLPKEHAINIIQYKLRYAHFHKQNPIYRKSTNVQPWILMGRISDDILDYVLRSVTTELEVNEILEDLYNAEFQY